MPAGTPAHPGIGVTGDFFKKGGKKAVKNAKRDGKRSMKKSGRR